MSRALSLAGVAVGAAGFGAALAATYGSMREVMVDNGGFCASGGPYAIAPGHQCSDRTWILTAAPFAGIVFVAVLVVASTAWSNGRTGGLGPLLFGATFAALGWNFLDLAIHPPTSMSSTGAWILCAVIFGLMALGGLALGGYGLRDYYRPTGSTPTPPVTAPPLVRAVVDGPRTDTALPGFSKIGFETGGNSDHGGNAYLWLVTTVAATAAGAYAVAAMW